MTGRPDADATAVATEGQPQATLNLAMIGNCAVSALIDSRGRIVWCCMPRFDGDPVFHALLGASSPGADDGHFSIELESLQRTEQSYDPGTAIVRTRLFDHSGQGIETPISRRASSTTAARSGPHNWCAGCVRSTATPECASSCGHAANGAAPRHR